MSEGQGAYLSGVAPDLHGVRLPRVAESVAEDVARAGLPDHCEAAEDGFVERAVSSIEAAAPLPIDENGHADRRLVSDLERDDRLSKESDDRAAACRARHAELEEALVRLPGCWSRLRLASTVGAFVVLAIIAGIVVGAVLTPTLDGGFLANYLPRKFDGDARLLVMVVAFLAAGGFVSLLCLLELCVVVGTAGNMSALRTSQLLLLDLAFAAAWGLQRLADGGGLMAASITLLEFVAMAAYALALGALAPALKQNVERARAYRDAEHRERAAARACTRAEARNAATSQARRALLDAVAARELSARSEAVRKKLVGETARAAYRVATGALIEAATANPTLDRLHADLDRQLAARTETVVKPVVSKGLA